MDQMQSIGQASQTQGNPMSSGRRQGSKKWLVPSLIILLVLLSIGGFLLFRSPQEKKQEDENFVEPTVIQEPTPTPTPTPTPEPVDRSQISVSVLNGTGIAGEASLLKGKLEEAGYSQIEAGNAGDQTHTTTEVTVSAGVPDEVKNDLQNLLEEIYQDVEVSRGTSGSADIVITTGLRPGQSLPTPTPTVTKTPTPTPTATDSATPQ